MPASIANAVLAKTASRGQGLNGDRSRDNETMIFHHQSPCRDRARLCARRRFRASPRSGRAAEAGAAELDLRGHVRHVSTRPSCSAASRSTRRSAAIATHSASRSAISSQPDGPGFTEDQVKALAASYQVTNAEPNDKGEIFKRPGTPADICRAPNPTRTTRPPRRLSARRRPTWPARQGAQVRARLPVVRVRRAARSRIPGDGRRLHLRDPQRLHEQRRSAVELYYPGHKIAMPQPIPTARSTTRTGRRRRCRATLMTSRPS